MLTKKQIMLRRKIETWTIRDKRFGNVVATPYTLVNDVIKNVDIQDKSILVMFNLEFVLALLQEHNVNPSNITVLGTSEFKGRICDKLGVNYITEYTKSKQFDVVFANPPYSEENGNRLIYPQFFADALELADTVAMIMPENLEANWRWFIKHNKLVKQHSYKMMDVTDYFNVSMNSIHCVFASQSVNNPIEEIKEKVFDTILPERQRLNPIKGNFPTARVKPVEGGDINVITKVHKSGANVEAHNSQDLRNAVKSYDNVFYSGKAEYLVMLNHTPSKGKFNTEIVKVEKPITWSNFVFALECSNREEAEQLKAWLASDTIVNQVKVLLDGKYTIALKQIRQLPWYE